MSDFVGDLAEGLRALLEHPWEGCQAVVEIVDERKIRVTFPDGALDLGPGSIVCRGGCTSSFWYRRLAGHWTWQSAVARLLEGRPRLVGSVGEWPVYEVAPRRASDAGEDGVALFTPRGVFIRRRGHAARRLVTDEDIWGTIPAALAAGGLEVYRTRIGYRRAVAFRLGNTPLALAVPLRTSRAMEGQVPLLYGAVRNTVPQCGVVAPLTALDAVRLEGSIVDLDAGFGRVQLTVEGVGIAAFVVDAGPMSVAGAWMPRAGDVTVLSPPDFRFAASAQLPSLPAWDALADELGCRDDVGVVHFTSGSMRILSPDGRAWVGRRRGKQAEEAAVIDGAGRLTTGMRDAEAHLRLDYEGLPPPPLTLDAKVYVDEGTRDVLWDARLGELRALGLWVAGGSEPSFHFAVARSLEEAAEALVSGLSGRDLPGVVAAAISSAY